ncbi:MAG: hypothetical protein D6E12_05635 [Desulfovibrio sp.]|nr:MAG: hypothetical protein D6E12_05635 [Desulfovibrio sp.]
MKNRNSLLLVLVLFSLIIISGCAASSGGGSDSSSSSSGPSPETPLPPEPTTDSERIGDMFLQANKLDEALIQYDMAISQGADRASVAFRKGFVYMAKGMYQQSLDWFTVAIGNDNTMTMAYEGAGKSTLELGNLLNAAAFFEGATQQSPGYWVPHVYLAAIFNVLGDGQNANEQMEIAKTLVPENDNSIYMTLAVAQQRAERAAEMNPHEVEDYQEMAAETATETSSPPETEVREITPPPAAEQEEPALEESETMAETEDAQEEEAAAEPEAMEETAEDQPEAAMTEEAAAEEPPATEEIAEATGQETQGEGNALDQALAEARENAAAEEQGEAAPAAEEPPAETPAPEPAVSAEVQTAESTPPTESESSGVAISGGGQTEAPQEAPALEAPPDMQATPVQEEPTPEEMVETAALDPSGYSYSILESSWRTEEEAQLRKSELLDKGVTAHIVPVNLPEKGLWYRVMVGEFANLEVATRMKNSLYSDIGLEHLNILRDGRFFQPIE